MNCFQVFFISILVVALCHLTFQLPNGGVRENKAKYSEVDAGKKDNKKTNVQLQEKKAGHGPGGENKHFQKSIKGSTNLQNTKIEKPIKNQKVVSKTKKEEKKQSAVHDNNKQTDKIKMLKNHIQHQKKENLTTNGFFKLVCNILKSIGLENLINSNLLLKFLCSGESTNATTLTQVVTTSSGSTSVFQPTATPTQKLIVTYAPVPSGCGSQTFEFPEGSFTSPGYPGDYGNNLNCSFLIRVATGQRVSLTFTDFATEYSLDYVEVYDGSTINSPLLLRFSGQGYAPVPVNSNSREMLLVFKTDASIVKKGFFAKYKTIAPSQNVTMSTPNPINECTSGDLANSKIGLILSPGYPLEYSNNILCTRIIGPVATGYRISLTFFDFEAEEGFDFLEIYDGSTTSSPLLLRATGSSIPAPLVSTSPYMLVVFKTDYSITRRGFSAKYTAFEGKVTTAVPVATAAPPPSGCGINFSNIARATFTSPGYPSAYGTSLLCSYTIIVNQGSRVSLSFNDIVTYSGSDFVEVYDGLSTSNSLLVKISGVYYSSYSNIITSSTNQMLVVFRSGVYYLGYRGFSATFTANSTGIMSG